MISIRRQLTRDLVMILAVLFGAGLLAIYMAVYYQLKSSFDTSLGARATAVSALTEFEAGKVQFDFSEDFLASYSANHPRNFFEIWDEQGTSLRRSLSLREAHLVPHEAGTAKKPEYVNLTLPNGRPGRAVAFAFVPTVDGVQPPILPAKVHLVVAVDRDSFNETLGGLAAAVAACGVLLLGTVFLVVPRVLRRGLRPLDELATQTDQIDADSLGRRFLAGKLPAELQPVARRLNDLLARLEASFDRERRFSADLAHELRTPLAELRSQAECAIKWPETRDAAMDQETLAIARQMEAMVGHMLALTRGEEGQLAMKLEPIALEPLVREVWGAFEEKATARGLQVTFALNPLMAAADPTLLRSIFSNLMENAVDYTPAGAELSIRLELSGGKPRFAVANPTTDLVAADLPKLFDRFWRKEAARTAGKHLGLGLSLARMFAVSMGWSLTAAFDEKQRLVFVVGGPGAELSPA
jgi:signal transduction histidine kinase